MTKRDLVTTLSSLIALGLVCLGQYYRLYLPTYTTDALIFFGLGLAIFAWTLGRAPWTPQAAETPPETQARPRWWLVIVAALLAIEAWLQSSQNEFSLVGVLSWWGAVTAFVAAFWTWRRPGQLKWPVRIDRAKIALQVSWHTLALVALIGLAIFFRFYRLDQIPPEMNSDHVEKLYDVYDVLHGLYSIYFERNTGREPMQFYLTAALIKIFNTGLTHYSLKLSNALMGVLSVIGVYLLGREVGGRKLGLLAGVFAAVSIWPVITSRIGLRYPFAPAFTSLALWSLLRALRTNDRNAWLLAGLILGVGLHGYTAFRAMPLAAAALVGLHIIARWTAVRAEWRRWLMNIAVYGVVAALVFIPLAHYMIERPQMFWYRSFTRVGDVERPLSGSPLQLFALTFSKTLGMFNWRGDEVWVCALPYAPVIDVISGGLLLLGVVYTLGHLSRKRGLLAAQIIMGGLILLLPSALSLAFPSESPSVVRAGGAMPIVAVLIGLALYHLAAQTRAGLGGRLGTIASSLLVAALLSGMVVINYHRHFVTYFDNYRRSAMNTREVSEAVRAFTSVLGDVDHVYLKGWPYWLDARAIALQIASPGWEHTHVALTPQDISSLPSDNKPRLYILHPADVETLDLLRTLYPQGWSHVYHPHVAGGDFVFFFAPGHD